MSTDSLVLETLLEMKSQFGEMHGTLKSLDSKLDNHITEDASVETRVKELELKQAEEKGARKKVYAIAAGLSTAAGLAVAFFTGK